MVRTPELCQSDFFHFLADCCATHLIAKEQGKKSSLVSNLEGRAGPWMRKCLWLTPMKSGSRRDNRVQESRKEREIDWRFH